MTDSPPYPGTPRWVKILGIISAALAAAFVAIHLAGGGFHHHSHFGAASTADTTGAGKVRE